MKEILMLTILKLINHNLLEEINEKINKKGQRKIYTNENNCIKSKLKTNINKYYMDVNATWESGKKKYKKFFQTNWRYTRWEHYILSNKMNF